MDMGGRQAKLYEKSQCSKCFERNFKTEKIYLQEMYSCYGQAKEEIARTIDFYNRRRPHMSIGMKKPMEVYTGEQPGNNLWKKK